MANRTNADDVKALLTRNYDSRRNPDLAGFISDANDIVNEMVAADTAGKITSARATRLEKYLTAHLYCLTDPTYKQRATEGASGTVLGTGGKGYDSSFFGQQAKNMDPTGFLNAKDIAMSRGKVKGFSLGKESC